MLQNYLKVAWRNITRNKSFAVISSLGLALGFACCTLIYSFVQYHLSFDNFHENANRIYRVVTEEHRDFIDYEPSVPPALGREFRNDYDYPEKVVRIATFGKELISYTQEGIEQKFKVDVALVEQEFFDIFNYPLLSGNSVAFLSEPNTALLTERMAWKLFGSADPVGQTFQLDNRIEITVKGVLKDIPANTRFQTEIYISYPTLKAYGGFIAMDSWAGISSDLQCYTLLKPNVSAKHVESELQKYVQKYRADNKNVHHYKLQSLSDVHFDTRYDGAISKRTLLVLALIGLFLIVAACINFINMATAQATSRSREIGVQKVLGSYKWQLFGRFLGETAILSFFSLIIGLLIAYLVLPYLSKWFNANILVSHLLNGQFLLFVLAMFISISLLAGVYPGMLLSGVSPILALKSKLTQQQVGGFMTRKSLIVAQFALSQLLIIGMIVIGRQMHFAVHSDLGFDKNAILTIPIPGEINDIARNGLKSRLEGLSGVQHVTACLAAPSSSDSWGTNVRYDSRTEDEDFSIKVKAADHDYLKTFGLKLIAGRNFFPSDTVRELVVNEMLVKKLNLKSPEEIIGKRLTINGASIHAPVVGVVADFHDMDLRSSINPVFIAPASFIFQRYAIKINMNNAQNTIEQIKEKWAEVFPGYLFEYEFLDDHIAQFYESEKRILKLIQIFTVLAIFISCLGMFGLVAYLVNRKTKEIGVRKVLGGSIVHVLWLFLQEFFRLILVAAVISIPVSWLLMDNWLQNFEYKIEIEVWIFAAAIGASIVIALATVGFQSLKAAFMNPAKSLKYE